MLDNKHINVIANIGSYKPGVVIRRVMLVSLVSVILFAIGEEISGANPPDIPFFVSGYLLVAFAFNSVSELNIFLVTMLRKVEVLRHRIVPQALIILIFTTLVAYFWIWLASHLYGNTEIIFQPITQLSFLFGLFILFIVHMLVMMSNITKEWMESRREIEQLKNAKLQSDYNSLQDRLNPHFLFNNLSVLKSLIHYSPEDAEVFTQNFTDVYRYVLHSHESRTVSVKRELEFSEAYIALHQERLGEGLSVSFKLSDGVMNKQLPPMSIQLLVENAIKHNVASRSHPLHIEVYSEGEVFLCVKNVIYKKETTYSTEMGLKTLQSQYQLISPKQVEIWQDEKVFLVKLPLL